MKEDTMKEVKRCVRGCPCVARKGRRQRKAFNQAEMDEVMQKLSVEAHETDDVREDEELLKVRGGELSELNAVDAEKIQKVNTDKEAMMNQVQESETPLDDSEHPVVEGSPIVYGLEYTETDLNMFLEETELNAVSQEPTWRHIEAVVDSGAAESVAPPSLAPWAPMEESPGSRRGQHYLSASGERLPNLGQKTLDVVTEDGMAATTKFQIADVTRPLCAVSKICDQDNVVVFTRDGGFVEGPTGMRMPFRRERNVYLMDTYALEPAGFTRPR